MSGISTHVLDLSAGRPGAGMAVTLLRGSEAGEWTEIGRAVTDADGRAKSFPGAGAAAALSRGHYRLRFDTGAYFASRGIKPFFPFVEISFAIEDERQNYHVPLLLSPFGYSTYRGS